MCLTSAHDEDEGGDGEERDGKRADGVVDDDGKARLIGARLLRERHHRRVDRARRLVTTVAFLTRMSLVSFPASPPMWEKRSRVC